MTTRLEEVESILPEPIRHSIEEAYYRQVNVKASLERIACDRDFMQSPTRHVAFFSDHGVVHVRDVSRQILRVLLIVNGTLIPRRESQRLEFMRGYGVMVAYLHDIGMRDFSAFGRAMHPEFAAQEVFLPEYDSIVETLWDENAGNVAWRLLNIADRGGLEQPPRQVLREMLAMSICHSKSKVPIGVLNSRTALRDVMRRSLSTDLPQLHSQHRVSAAEQAVEKGEKAGVSPEELASLREKLQTVRNERDQLDLTPLAQPGRLKRLYDDFDVQAYRWLLSDRLELIEMGEDVCDTLRSLRCADALRQRGAVLKTSAGYQIFVDYRSANCIHAFEDFRGGKMFLLETEDPIAAGEANLAASEVDQNGDLRISFQRGSFTRPNATEHAIRSAALIVIDIQADVIDSFIREDTARVQKTAEQMRILIEATEDNPEFAREVVREIERRKPHLAGRCLAVPSLKNISDIEREIYMRGTELNWSMEQRRELLAQVALTGHRTQEIDPDRAFEHVRLIEIEAGAVLLEAGSPPGFVYLPMSAGLRGTPLGGYQTFPLPAWGLLGTTGAIRGAPRNATVVAERQLSLLMIPKEIFLKYWHASYSIDEFRAVLSELYGPGSSGE